VRMSVVDTAERFAASSQSATV